MPANLTPEYKAAEAAFRKARDPQERLEWLREMLRVIPKHKGTDHLQADIKRRIKDLAEELERPIRGGARGGPVLVVRPEGAAQVALIGAPNVGKSSLHARLTGSNARAAPYPYSTQYPEPGMMRHEDVQFQLLDLPPVSTAHRLPWIANTLQTADACLLIADLGDSDCIAQVEAVRTVLREQNLLLVDRWEPRDGSLEARSNAGDSLALRIRTLLLANKADRLADAPAELRAFLELSGLRYPALSVSAITGHGLGEIGAWLFGNLEIVRVYTKTPGKPPDRGRPFTLRRGDTIADVARLVHRDLAGTLKHARVWGRSGYDGQHVGPEHALADGDIVELHT